jgi:preprotein translocase subunit SecD
LNLEQLLLMAPLVIALIIAVILGVALHRNRATMTAMIGVIVLIALLINFLPSPIQVGAMQLDNSTRLGLDLQGGVQVVLEARQTADSPGDLPSRMEAARTIIEERVGGIGVSEPIVQLQGENRILVELPGVDDPDAVISLIRETGELEWIDADNTPLAEGTLVCTERGCPRPEQIARLQGGGVEVTPTAVVTGTPGTTLTSTTPITTTAVATSTLPAIPDATATTEVTATGTTTGTTGTTEATPSPTPYGGRIYPVVVTGDQVDGTKVQVQYDPTTGLPLVAFTLKGAGRDRLAEFTRTSVGQFMPIVLDKVVISSPSIRGEIPSGEGVIEGMTNAEANALVIKLRYGALPVPLDVVSNRTIGGTLGADSIQKSVIAGVVGLLLVMLFMLAYYRLPGLVANVALLIYSLVVFALFKSIPVTLTLAGIAGFILSIGMAVDANVLIFARLKEELRLGKTTRTAVEAGFDHAWPSIRDSNITTIISTGILYWFGSFFGASIIKGFALTLFVGVVISMFTAVLVTRTLLRLVMDTPLAQNRWWFGIDELKTPAAPPPTESGTQPLS